MILYFVYLKAVSAEKRLEEIIPTENFALIGANTEDSLSGKGK